MTRREALLVLEAAVSALGDLEHDPSLRRRIHGATLLVKQALVITRPMADSQAFVEIRKALDVAGEILVATIPRITNVGVAYRLDFVSGVLIGLAHALVVEEAQRNARPPTETAGEAPLLFV